MNPIIDQAAELRRLARQAARRMAVAQYDAPTSVFVTGGKVGVGTTSVAMGLALAAARDGARVVIADIDAHGGDVAARLQIGGSLQIGDVLRGKCELHEALQGGPFGLQVLPGAPGAMGPITGSGLRRLVSEVRMLGRHADLLVFDAGCSPQEPQRAFWNMASEVLMITATDSLAIVDAYSTLKQNRFPNDPAVGVLVNRGETEYASREVFQRLQTSCSRFLKTDIAWRGWLPYSTALTFGPRVEDCVFEHSTFPPLEQLARNYQSRLVEAPEGDAKIVRRAA